MNIEDARAIGVANAVATVRAAGTNPTNTAGESIIPMEYPDHWEIPGALETDEQVEAFCRAFEAAMDSQDWEVRPEGKTSWADGLSPLEACREKGRAIDRGLDKVRINFNER